jgi:hypothetical protein
MAPEPSKYLLKLVAKNGHDSIRFRNPCRDAIAEGSLSSRWAASLATASQVYHLPVSFGNVAVAQAWCESPASIASTSGPASTSAKRFKTMSDGFMRRSASMGLAHRAEEMLQIGKGP